MTARLWQWAPMTMLCTLAVLVVPRAGSSFSGPKLFVWAAFAAALALLLTQSDRHLKLTPPVGFAALNAVAWAIAALTGDAPLASAVLLQGLTAATWLVLAFHPPRADAVAKAATVAGALVAAVALAQAAGLDPLAAFGPERFAASRMSAYGTLGNPDFVAAFVTPCLVLAATRKRWLAAAVMVAALCITRSWATVVALLAAAAVLRRPKLALAALLPLAAASTRALDVIAQGRLEHWAHAWPDLGLVGHGPGAALALTSVDHVHNDLLERWLDAGPLGLIALVAPIAWALRRRTAAAAALAAFAARLLVDFPLARPAEACLFVFLVTTEEET